MRTTRLTALMLCFLGAATAMPTVHADDGACASMATHMLDAMGQGDYPAATRDMNGFMKMMFKPEQLKDNWAALGEKYGAYRSHGSAEATGTTVKIPLQFEHGQPTAVINCQSDGAHQQIASFAVI